MDGNALIRIIHTRFAHVNAFHKPALAGLRIEQEDAPNIGTPIRRLNRKQPSKPRLTITHTGKP